MLIVEPTKFGAGATLYGDYWDLRSLHGTIHDLAEGGPFTEHVKEYITALAYDVRHAYERAREEKSFGWDEHDKVTYLGVKILWPDLLFQLSSLRGAASYQPTAKDHQANLYRLECCVEGALKEYDAKTGEQCVRWLAAPLTPSGDYLPSIVAEVNYTYLFKGGPGKQRFRRLPGLLQWLEPLSREYQAFEARMKAIAQKQGCRAVDLHQPDDWPDFKW